MVCPSRVHPSVSLSASNHTQILRDCVAFVEYRGAKTVTVNDVQKPYVKIEWSPRCTDKFLGHFRAQEDRQTHLRLRSRHLFGPDEEKEQRGCP